MRATEVTPPLTHTSVNEMITWQLNPEQSPAAGYTLSLYTVEAAAGRTGAVLPTSLLQWQRGNCEILLVCEKLTSARSSSHHCRIFLTSPDSAGGRGSTVPPPPLIPRLHPNDEKKKQFNRFFVNQSLFKINTISQLLTRVPLTSKVFWSAFKG